MKIEAEILGKNGRKYVNHTYYDRIIGWHFQIFWDARDMVLYDSIDDPKRPKDGYDYTYAKMRGEDYCYEKGYWEYNPVECRFSRFGYSVWPYPVYR